MNFPVNPDFIRPRLLHRENDSHKGNYGHLLIVAGCESMPGAAVLATGAALQSGCGLVTLHSTPRALQAAANNFPSAMLSEAGGKCFSTLPPALDRYSAIAAGPGLSQSDPAAEALSELMRSALEKDIPMVLDADALNILATQPELQMLIPRGSVLTPHLGEFHRLFGGDANRDKVIQRFCHSSGSVLILKGFHTKVYTPEGDILTNTTGNAGLAKGGSGDVLTGLLGGLLARGYDSTTASALAVWIHGYVGDFLSATRTAEAYSSRDLIDHLWSGFERLYHS